MSGIVRVSQKKGLSHLTRTLDISYREMERLKIITRIEQHNLTVVEGAEALGIIKRQMYRILGLITERRSRTLAWLTRSLCVGSLLRTCGQAVVGNVRTGRSAYRVRRSALSFNLMVVFTTGLRDRKSVV